MARWSLWTLAVGIISGFLLGWMMWIWQADSFPNALRSIPAGRLYWGAAELGFYVLCMWIYLALWQRVEQGGRWIRIGHRSLAVLATTNLIYHFPPLFSIISAVSLLPELMNEQTVLSRAGFLQLMGNPMVVAHVVHFLLASIAVTGIVVMGFALKLDSEDSRSGDAATDSSESHRVAAWGAWVALVPTSLQLLAGIYLFLQLPATMQDALLGDHLLSTLVFGTSFIVVLGLVNQLFSIAFGTSSRKSIIFSMILMAITITLMVGTLHLARQQVFKQRGPKTARGEDWQGTETLSRRGLFSDPVSFELPRHEPSPRHGP